MSKLTSSRPRSFSLAVSTLLLGLSSSPRAAFAQAAQFGTLSGEGSPNPEAAEDESSPQQPSDPGEVQQVTEEETTLLTVEFRASPECPNKADFLRSLAERLPQITRGDASAQPSHLLVTIEHIDEVYVGKLQQSRPDGLSEERRIEGASCSEVIDALSVVAAIALETKSAFGGQQSEESIEPNDASEDPGSTGEGGPPAGTKLNEETMKAPILPTERILFDAQSGAAFGTLPKMPVPRLDFALGYAAWMSPWKNGRHTKAIIARARFNYLFRTKSSGARQGETSAGEPTDIDLEVMGFSVTAGGCFAPYFNPQGATLAGCVDAGISDLVTATDVRGEGGYIFRSLGVRLGASVDGTYVLDELFHLAGRVGYEGNVIFDTPPSDAEFPYAFHPKRHAIYATVGVGIHF